MQKVTPCLWFDDDAEEAISFYVSLIKDSKIDGISRYPQEVPGRGGKVLTINFTLGGSELMALNGGPQYNFTEAISLSVDCEDQKEVDRLWEALTEGGEESQCGWLKDKYGLSWQIVPKALGELLGDPDPVKAGRVMQAMLKMRKIDVAALKQAYAG